MSAARRHKKQLVYISAEEWTAALLNYRALSSQPRYSFIEYLGYNNWFSYPEDDKFPHNTAMKIRQLASPHFQALWHARQARRGKHKARKQ